jgi:hypothetical protein
MDMKNLLQLFGLTILLLSSQHFLSAQNFSEDFESGFIPETFTLINQDGLTPALADEVSWADTAWIASQSASFDGFAALSISWYEDADGNEVGPCQDWLILPQLTIEEGAVFQFDVKSATTSGNYPDDYWVLINTGDPTAESFESDGTVLLMVDDEVSDDFRNVSIDLTDYNGQTVYLAILNVTNTGGYGLWVDNVFVGTPNSTEDTTPFVTHMNVLPNPSTVIANLQYELKEKADVRIMVRDIQGKVVGDWQQGVQSVGQYRFEVPTSNMAEGIYNLTLYAGNQIMTRRINVTR